MNTRVIVHTLGRVLQAVGLLMLLPLILALCFGESAWTAFAVTVGGMVALGTLMSWRKPENRTMYAKEGFVIVSLAWIGISVGGALPFWISGEIPSFVDAFFETVSGFTTTGSTILTDVETLPQSLLFWRSFTHWIGGMGVLVFVMALIPLGGGRSMHLLRAESPGPEVGKLVPRMGSSAKILYGIYILFTLAEVLLLILGGVPVLDSFIVTFGSVGTGGFSPKNASIAYYDSAYVDAVVTIFMTLCGVNFNMYYYLFTRQYRQVLKNEELRWYLILQFAAMLIVTVDILPIYHSFGTAFRYASFQVSTINTTTGYATADYNLWPQLSQCVLVLMMLFGGSAGSTAGGLKTVRVVLAVKGVSREIHRMLHRRSVSVLRLDGKPVREETISGVHLFLFLYAAILCLSTILISVDGFDFATNLSASIATLSNIGPGLNLVGPMGNFSQYSAFSKLVLSADMLLGRLEIFPLIMLFSPDLWKK